MCCARRPTASSSSRTRSFSSSPLRNAMDHQRFADDIQHGHARVQGREGVLEDDLHFPPVGLHLIAGQFEDIFGFTIFANTALRPSVGSMARKISRPVVVLPQPDSPTRPSVSPWRMKKSTPSTARTCPTTRRSKPRWMGKCFFKLRTSSSFRPLF